MFKKLKHIILCFFCLVLLTQPAVVLADNTNYRTCTTANTCAIGEFLFDDDSSPNLAASCNFTSKYPDGTAHLTGSAMTTTSDGWRAITVTTPGLPLGLYRAQMCCTVVGDLLCMDKSFIIAAPAAVSAADIWNYPDRSMTNFSTLVSDIWSSTTRRLTGPELNTGSLATSSEVTATTTAVNNVATNVNSATTAINSAATNINSISSTVNSVSSKLDSVSSTSNSINSTVNNTATTLNADLTGLAKQMSLLNDQVTRNNNLIERVVNKPVIQTFIEEGEPVSLSEKITRSKEIALGLMGSSQSIQTQLASLDTNWKQASESQAIASIATVSQVLGASSATDANQQTSTLASQAVWLHSAWNHPIINRLTDRVDSTLSNSSSTAREIRAYGKSPTSQQYLKLATEDLSRLQKLIGSSKDDSTAQTLFGFIRQIEDSMRLLTNYSEEIDQILSNLDKYPRGDLHVIISDMEAKIMVLNQLPSISPKNITHKTTAHPLANEENKLLGLKAVINANLLLMAQQIDKPIKNIWIENGSIIFKALVTNPSSVVTQKVPIKYYLPAELTEKDIIKLDDGLTVKYDAQERSLFVSGEVELAPNASKTYEVKTANVWIVDPESLEALRKQTEILFSPLKSTSYFAQGAVLKADIDVSLDKAAVLLKDSHTPESRIRDFRQALIEIKSAQDKIEDLKSLASSAGSVGTVFGFVGGVQTVAVWGMVIILLAGFVFLALYLKMITQGGKSKNLKIQPTPNFTVQEATEQMMKQSDHSEVNHAVKDHSKHDKKSKSNTNLHQAFIQSAGKTWVIKTAVAIGLFSILSLTSMAAFLIGKKQIADSRSSEKITLSQALESSSSSSKQSNKLDVLNQSDVIEAVVGLRKGDKVEKSPEPTQDIVLSVDSNTSVLGVSTQTQSTDLGNTTAEPKPIVIKIPTYGKVVNVREEPDLNSKSIYLIWTTKNALELARDGEWVKVELPDPKNDEQPIMGWVFHSFVSEIELSENIP